MAEIKKEVGQLIRITRKAKKLTQKELGEKMGVSESAVSGYERGQNLTVETLNNVALALGVKLMVPFG